MRGWMAALGAAGIAAVAFGGGYVTRWLTSIPTFTPPRAEAEAASEATRATRDEILKTLPFANRQDFDFGARGFVATLEDPVIRGDAGQVVYDLSSYDFLKGDAPESVNPSLWRQAQLLTRHGLYKVTDRIYQVRGFDVSVVSFLLTDGGVVVVDPLTTVEAARAALGLFRKHVGELPVRAVIYSHSHADHFGGVRGVVSPEDVAAGAKIIAPSGFLEHAVAENVIAGNAMARRARFQFGQTLPRGPEGEVTSGLGPGISRGALSLLAPTDLIAQTGQEMTIDGLTLVFQLTPGTEAPAEMNFYMPAQRAVFMAENANATMHNVLTPRGALVRDAKAWADYLTEAIRLFAGKSDVLFAAHGIPRFGQAELTDFLKKHRDAYKYLHDQSVRLMNQGLTGPEIAQRIALPDVLAQQWYNRGYYGTMSFNSRAVYQRYMGWYDGNPASLDPLPPELAAQRYVTALGGTAATIAKADAAAASGDVRFAVMLLNHVVFAEPANEGARKKLAALYTQLGYQAESGIWRNMYLTGAQELTQGVVQLPSLAASPDFIRATPTAMLLDFAAVRLNPEKAAGKTLRINLVLSDFGNETHLITVENGVLVHEQGVRDPAAQATLTMARIEFLQTLFLGVPLAVKTATGAIAVEGDAAAYGALMEMIDPLDPNFPIVTP